jgi:aconitate hydratase
LQFLPGENASSLGLTGDESFDLLGIADIAPRQTLTVRATRPDGTIIEFGALVRIDSPIEAEYFRNGGILQTVLRRLTRTAA